MPVLASTIGYLVGGPPGAAIAGGGYNYSQNHNIGQALASAGGSYIGSNIGGAVLGDKLGTVGSTLSNTLGQGIGSTAANAIGPALANTAIGSVLGGSVGGDLASSLAAPKQKAISQPGESPFSPTQQAEKSLPLSLTGAYGSLTNQQRGSGIATQGVYGSGNGPEENAYYLNLINRRLVDESGNVDQNFSDINPVENSYLAQLGLGGKNNPRDLLQAIQGWKA